MRRLWFFPQTMRLVVSVLLAGCLLSSPLVAGDDPRIRTGPTLLADEVTYFVTAELASFVMVIEGLSQPLMAAVGCATALIATGVGYWRYHSLAAAHERLAQIELTEQALYLLHQHLVKLPDHVYSWIDPDFALESPALATLCELLISVGKRLASHPGNWKAFGETNEGERWLWQYSELLRGIYEKLRLHVGVGSGEKLENFRSKHYYLWAVLNEVGRQYDFYLRWSVGTLIPNHDE